MTSAASPRDYLAGQLLIAMPNMGDTRFERSVVLMCSHGDDHAMGVVINKQIKDVTIGELLKQLEINARLDLSNRPVFYGGPVQQDRGLVVHTLDYQSDETLVVCENIGITGTREILADVGNADGDTPGPERYMLALGHAGWSGGQLEEEISMNAWAHADVDLDIVFSGGSEDSWRRALKRLGVTGAMLSPEWASVRGDDTFLH